MIQFVYFFVYNFRCEAINKANEQNPAVSRIGYRVFFPPQSLAIVVDRPDKGSGYDRTIDFELAVGVASSSTRNRNRQDDVRIVVAGELVTLRCEAGNCFQNLPLFFIFKAAPAKPAF